MGHSFDAYSSIIYTFQIRTLKYQKVKYLVQFSQVPGAGWGEWGVGLVLKPGKV